MMELNFFKIPCSSRALLLSAIFSLSNALPRPGPDPTASYRPADWSPRPTSVPQPHPELLKRDNQSAGLCGWVNGIANYPVVCPDTKICVYDTAHAVVGCCPQSGACTTGVYNGCVNAEQTAMNPSILTCLGGSICYQNSYAGGFFQWACGASTDANQIATTYHTTNSGQNSVVTLQVAYTSLAFVTSLVPNPTGSTSTVAQSSSPSASALGSQGSGSVPQVSTSVSSSLTVGLQSQASTPTASAVVVDEGPQNQTGIIAGSVVGGLSVVFAVVALGCLCLQQRRRRQVEERARSFATKEKTISINSYASSRISSRSGFHPFSPDDVISPLAAAPESDMLPNQPAMSEEPRQEPEQEPPLLSEPESPHIRRVQLVDNPRFDELADLPPPWVRPPTPPPRSPKRLTRLIKSPQDHTPLEVYLSSPRVSVHPSVSISSRTSDTSHYSRTSDGRSIGETGVSGWQEDAVATPMPTKPIKRKPVGSGWYRTMTPLVETRLSNHEAFNQASDGRQARDRSGSGSSSERSLTAPKPSREGSSSESVPTPKVDDLSGFTYNQRFDIIDDSLEVDIAGTESDWVPPLRLKNSPTAGVMKRGYSPVPILGVPAAPSPGERGHRLYDI